MHQHRLEAAWLESSFAEKALGVVVGKMTISHQCAVVAKAANSSLGCVRQSLIIKLREVIFPLC